MTIYLDGVAHSYFFSLLFLPIFCKVGALPNVVHILNGHLSGPRPPAELLSLPLASVTSVTPNYMPLKDRWKDSGSGIATAAKTSPVGPSYVGKRAL